MFSNSILQGKRTIYSKALGEEILHLGQMTYDIPERMGFQTVVVSKDHVARPDLISLFAYGDDKYGDLICKLNGISNPFELNEGDVIVLPGAGDLESFFVLDTFDDSNELNSNDSIPDNTPRPKQKTEKRKPNEAVMGDTRFKVDKTRRLIIY